MFIIFEVLKSLCEAWIENYKTAHVIILDIRHG